MRKETLILAFVTASVALAGCFGGGGSVDGVQRDCGTVQATLLITQTTNANIPLYTLNDGETQQVVVAMGFQPVDSNGNPADLEVPNPEIRLKECQTLELTIENTNPMPHTFHMHGGIVDWDMDGVPFVSQMPIMSGNSYTYVYEDLKAGTYWYHCHVDVAHHIDLGMYGAFIVEEWEPTYPYDGEFVLMLDEWDNCHVHGGLSTPPPREDTGGIGDDQECTERQFQDYYSAGGTWQNLDQVNAPLCSDPNIPPEIKQNIGCTGNQPPDQSMRTWYPMTFPLYNPTYNTFTMNGKAFPDTEPMFFEEGMTYKVRLINVGEEWHSMHLHGHNFLITHRDGYEDPYPQRADTISIGPGERYDLLIEADNPGFWVFHDHVGLNVMNDHVSPGGMLTTIAYLGDFADGVGFEPVVGMTAMDVVDFTRMYHMEHGGHTMSAPGAERLIASDRDGQVVLHSDAVTV